MSNRIQKVNSLLEREIGKIISREISFPDGVLVTITHVEATANLIEAKVFVSVFPEDKMDGVVKILDSNVRDIQRKINKTLRMRPIPKIIFAKDQTVSRAGRVEELLTQLKKGEK